MLTRVSCAHAHVENKMADVATLQQIEGEKTLSLSLSTVSCFKKVNFQALDRLDDGYNSGTQLALPTCGVKITTM